MSRYDGLVSSEAWNRLVNELTTERDEDEEPVSDHRIAEIVRNIVTEVEGEDI